jgi:hypothetical protein
VKEGGLTDQFRASNWYQSPFFSSARMSHCFCSSSRLWWMYCSNWPTLFALNVWLTVFLFLVCSARSRVLNRPRRMLTKAS